MKCSKAVYHEYLHAAIMDALNPYGEMNSNYQLMIAAWEDLVNEDPCECKEKEDSK